MTKIISIFAFLLLFSLISQIDCGPGGYLVLINNTTQPLIRTEQYAYQMVTWNWPRRIESGANVTVYFEYSHNIFKTWTDDSGDVTYSYTKGSKKAVVLLKARHQGGPYGSDPEFNTYAYRNVAFGNPTNKYLYYLLHDPNSDEIAREKNSDENGLEDELDETEKKEREDIVNFQLSSKSCDRKNPQLIENI